MKRTLILAVVLLGSAMAFGQISGSWEGKLALLPAPPTLDETTFTLTYAMGDWTITGTSVFEDNAFSRQEFAINGSLDVVNLEASLCFVPQDEEIRRVSYLLPDEWTGMGFDVTIIDSHWVIAGPHFKSASIKADAEFAGAKLEATVTLETNKVLTLAGSYVEDYILYLDFPSYIGEDDTIIMQPHPFYIPDVVTHPCYRKYTVTYGNASLVAKKVKFEGKDLGGNPVSHTVEGTFEVYYLDAETGVVILTLGAEGYLWQYIAQYGAEHNWDLSTVTYSVDIADVEANLLFPSYMTYAFTVTMEPLMVAVTFDDVSTGVQFKEATIELTGLSLCCGISYDVELHLTKCEGFDYIKFTAANLFELCCDISFGVDVEFGVDYKKVTPKFTWGGLEGCVTVWGDLQGLDNGVGIGGWELYGYKIYCELAECYALEFVTAMKPSLFYIDAEGNLVVNPSDVTGLSPVFKDDEFEYVKFGACGPACCGGNWELDVSVYFGGEALFGISRFVVAGTIPLMEALTVGFEFESPDSLALTWSFAF